MVVTRVRFWFLAFLAFTGGCAAKTETPAKPYRVEVLGISSVPDETAPPRYSVEARTLASLKSLDGLSGDGVILRTGGELSIKTMAGSVIMGEKFGGGGRPRLRYDVRDGVVVPLDYTSLAMLSAYAQFDVIFSRLEALVGLDPLLLAQAQANRRYEVLFEPRIAVETDAMSGSLAMKRNAAFIPGQGQFVLFERSLAERVPLSCNLQVLAHEFGHAIFDYTFFKNSFSDDDRYMKMETILGLNEGFADFFSYLMSGSTDVLTASLGENAFSRERNFAKIGFTRASAALACQGGFYCLGTLFAKSLYEAYKPLAEPEASAFRKALPAALSGAREVLDVQNGDDEETTLILFLENVAGVLAGAVPSGRTSLCQALGRNFSLSFGATSVCREN